VTSAHRSRFACALLVAALVISGLLVGGALSIRNAAAFPMAVISSFHLPATVLAAKSESHLAVKAPASVSPIAPSAAVPVTSFEGLIFGANGPYTNRYAPPDVQVAAGPNHVVEMVNALGRVWTKQGAVVDTFTLHSFFAVPASDFISDPKIRFDASSRRWFASITDVTTGDVLLAASTSDDPAASWNQYSFPASSGCADQPLLGMSDDKVVLSANDYSSCTARNPSYAGVEYWIINKADLTSGATARFARFGPDSSLFSLQPVASLGPTTTQYLVTDSNGLTTTLSIFAVTGLPPGTVSVVRTDLTILLTVSAPSATQMGSNSHLDTSDPRVQDAIWESGHLWLALDDSCVPTGDISTRACVRLIEVDTANSVVAQDFDVGISGKHVFYPAVRTDAAGRLFVVFGYSSSTDFPGLMTSVRLASDPVNTIGTPQVLRVGAGAEAIACSGGVCRYGDYFGAARDPADPTVVWVAGEYGTASGWATFIAAMSATVRISASYAIDGGGIGYQAPDFTYVQDGVTKSAPLTGSPVTFAVDGGSTWSVPQALLGSGASERWATNQNISRPASVDISIVFTYTHQYFDSFTYRVTGGGTGYGAPLASHALFGSPVASTANVTDWADAGTAYAFPTSLDGSNATERWAADAQAATGTVTAAGVIEVVYRHQAYVTFEVQGPPDATVSPGSGWYDVGSSITATASAMGWAAGEWIGLGPGSYSGSESAPSISVENPLTETAVMYPGLTIVAGVGGSVAYAYNGGSGTVAGGSTRTIYVRPGTAVSVVATSSGVFSFSGWSGGATGSQANASVTVNAPTQVVANFSFSTTAAVGLVSAVGVILFVLLLLIVARRRRKRPPSEVVPPPPSTPPLPPP